MADTIPGYGDTDRPVDITEPREPGASLGELVSRLAELTSRLVRDEIQLAKAELRQDIKQYGKAGGMLGAAGYAGHLTVLALVLTLGFALGDLLDNTWLGFLIVMLITGAVAAVLAVSGKKKLDQATPPVEQTRESVQETAQYLKERV